MLSDIPQLYSRQEKVLFLTTNQRHDYTNDIGANIFNKNLVKRCVVL